MTVDGRRSSRDGLGPRAEAHRHPSTFGAGQRAGRRSPSSVPPAPVSLESGLGFRLSRLARTLRTDWSWQLSELGLTPPQAAVLRGVAGCPGCSLRALARVLGAEPMTAKRCVDDLEGRGLLESAHRGEDRRPRALELTPKGRALVERVDAQVRIQEQRLRAALGPDRRALLEEALGALEADLGLSPGSRDRAPGGKGGRESASPAPSRARPFRAPGGSCHDGRATMTGARTAGHTPASATGAQ